MPSKSYPTEAAALSDEELKTLSVELREAYLREDREGFEYWLDDEAGARYGEMRAEEHRRFRLANPDWKPPAPGELMRLMLADMKSAFHAHISLNTEFDQAFRQKIGHTVSTRPSRLITGPPREANE